MTSVWDDLARTVGEFDDEAVTHDLFMDRVLPSFAERLSIHGDIARAARSVHVSHADGMILYRRICHDLGRQAT